VHLQQVENLDLIQNQGDSTPITAPEPRSGQRIGIDAAMQEQIAEKRIHGSNHTFLGGVGVKCAVPCTVFAQPCEPVCNQASRNPFGPGDMAVPAPFKENADVGAAAINA